MRANCHPLSPLSFSVVAGYNVPQHVTQSACSSPLPVSVYPPPLCTPGPSEFGVATVPELCIQVTDDARMMMSFYLCLVAPHPDRVYNNNNTTGLPARLPLTARWRAQALSLQVPGPVSGGGEAR